jgi:hypothetical protein
MIKINKKQLQLEVIPEKKRMIRRIPKMTRKRMVTKKKEKKKKEIVTKKKEKKKKPKKNHQEFPS